MKLKPPTRYLFFIISIIGVIIVFYRHALFPTETEKKIKENEYSKQLIAAQKSLDEFNKNTFPFMEFQGVIRERRYIRDHGDRSSIVIELVSPPKIGKIPEQIKYIYDLRNKNSVEIFYHSLLDDGNIGDTITKKWGEDFFRVSDYPLPKSEKIDYTKEMFLK